MDVFRSKTDSDKRDFNVKEPFQSLFTHLGRLVLTDKQVKFYELLTFLKQIRRWGVFKEQPLPLLVGFFFFPRLLQWLVLLHAAERTTVSSPRHLHCWHQPCPDLTPQPKETKNSSAGIPEVENRLSWSGMLLAKYTSIMEKKNKSEKDKNWCETRSRTEKETNCRGHYASHALFLLLPGKCTLIISSAFSQQRLALSSQRKTHKQETRKKLFDTIYSLLNSAWWSIVVWEVICRTLIPDAAQTAPSHSLPASRNSGFPHNISVQSEGRDHLSHSQHNVAN